MSKCQDMQGAMAASLYEALDVSEQAALDQHLSTCMRCHTEFTQLRATVATFSAGAVGFEGNLLPGIREELRRQTDRRWTPFFSYKIIVFSSLLFVCGGIYLFHRSHDSATNLPGLPVDFTDQVTAQAEARLAADDGLGALALLKAARDAADSTMDAGVLQARIADIEFSVLHRYELSYVEYGRLREEYGGAHALSDAVVKDRFDLLTEARESNFEVLYQMDNARSQGEAGLPLLEQVMARYPGRTLARQALDTMVALVEEDGIEALEKVKRCCTNPVTLAQIDVHLGERYWAERSNREHGRQLLEGVAGGEYEVPARMARDVLARLEAEEK